MYIERVIKKSFEKALRPGRVLVLLGARRVGKTAFIRHFLKEYEEKYLLLNGENTQVQESLQARTPQNYGQIIGKARLLVIDEAQHIPNIGPVLKFLADERSDVKIAATGSSAFDLSNQLGEPLVGRKLTMYLYPLSQKEFSSYENMLETRASLEQRLLFGSYPELVHLSGRDEKIQYLRELSDAYLLRDILQYEGIRNSGKIKKLLRLIAFQAGSLVSFNELSRNLGIHKNTVERYLDLLTKVFILYPLSGFSRNLRKEVTKMNKWYFYDNGIRNAVIDNFNTLGFRDDTGVLWENYLLSERIKFQACAGLRVNNYYWRTYQQQEIDWIEEGDGKLEAYEVKWSKDKKVKVPSAWRQNYPQGGFQVITPENYLDWIV